MKITLEPTQKLPGTPHHSITVSVPSDDLGFEETMELLKGALIAWGFAPQTVEDYWKE